MSVNILRQQDRDGLLRLRDYQKIISFFKAIVGQMFRSSDQIGSVPELVGFELDHSEYEMN